LIGRKRLLHSTSCVKVWTTIICQTQAQEIHIDIKMKNSQYTRL